jgi:hypothetical protein
MDVFIGKKNFLCYVISIQVSDEQVLWHIKVLASKFLSKLWATSKISHV